jgi:hypothetical protein
MRDLRHQLRDYIEESADPVTIEDVFFAGSRTPAQAPRPALRRPWGIAAAAAAVTALLFGLVPRLLGDSTTPSTVAPATTAPTPTTTLATTTTSSPPTTTAAVVLPDGDAIGIDERLEAVLADLLVAAEDLGWTEAVALEASLGDESDPQSPRVLATMSRSGSFQDDESDLSRVSFDEATVRVYSTAVDSEGAFDVLEEEILQGIPRVVQQQTAFDLIEAGEESAASFFTLGASAYASLVVRDGSWIVSVNFASDWPSTVEPGTALLDLLGSDEAQTELETLLDAIFGARDRGADQSVSLLRVPLVPPRTDAEIYEHGWRIVADFPDQPDPDFVEDASYIEQSHTLAVTPDSVRCRFWEVPYGEIEPQGEIQYLDDGSGTISLSERDGNEFAVQAELQPTDPRFVEAMAACRRFEPVSEVLDLIVSAWPGVPGAAEQALNGEASRTGGDTWVVVEREQERAFDLDPSLLVTLGITDAPVPTEIEITRWSAWIYSDFVQFELNATGDRSVVEAVFGVDLSDTPEGVIDFTLGFEFGLVLGG